MNHIILSATTLHLIIAMARATWPFQCCSPPQWQAILLDFNSLYLNPVELIVAHDDATRMEGILVKELGYQAPYLHVIRDFIDMTTYIIELDRRNPTCSSEPLRDTFFTSCASFQSLGATHVFYQTGGYSGLPSSNFTFDSWAYTIDEKHVLVGLSRDTCMPIYKKVKSVPGASYQADNLYFYYNATSRITSPGIMTIPDSCTFSTNTQ